MTALFFFSLLPMQLAWGGGKKTKQSKSETESSRIRSTRRIKQQRASKNKTRQKNSSHSSVSADVPQLESVVQSLSSGPTDKFCLQEFFVSFLKSSIQSVPAHFPSPRSLRAETGLIVCSYVDVSAFTQKCRKSRLRTFAAWFLKHWVRSPIHIK